MVIHIVVVSGHGLARISYEPVVGCLVYERVLLHHEGPIHIKSLLDWALVQRLVKGVIALEVASTPCLNLVLLISLVRLVVDAVQS